MRADEDAVYRFCTGLHQDKRVEDGVFEDVMKIFGERGAVVVMAVCGYYTLARMMLTLARKPLPGSVRQVFAAYQRKLVAEGAPAWR